jgi:hypothetical protein
MLGGYVSMREGTKGGPRGSTCLLFQSIVLLMFTSFE